MKIKQLVSLHHPHWSGSFLLRKVKVRQFLDMNSAVWEENNIDVDLFIEEDVFLKDNELEDILRKEYPEWFL